MSVAPARLRSTLVLGGRPGEPHEELSGGLGDRYRVVGPAPGATTRS
jgi:hypothetical protein